LETAFDVYYNNDTNYHLQFSMKANSYHAVQQLYVDHHDFLFHWLASQLNNQADIYDILQETFLSLLEQQETLDQIIQPRAFLLTIAKRKMYRLWRRRNLEYSYLEKNSSNETDRICKSEQQILLYDVFLLIDYLLDGLPQNVKYAFLLRKIDQLPYLEIAEKLSLSLATIERYVKQATLQCSLRFSVDH